MPESQVPPQVTPPQATSPSPQGPQRPQEPPRKVGDPPRKSAKKASGAPDEQQAQRAKQMEARAQVEKKNPFSAANRAARMQDVMNTLREERGVPQPREKAQADEQNGQAASGSDADNGAAEPSSKPDHGVARSAPVEGKQDSGETPSSDQQPEWYKREQAAQASERKASEALANAERVRAETEKAKADAEAAVKRLADAKDDPIQFMAEAGMTKDEWNAYVANGGQLSAEQKKMRTMAENMAKMQARLDAAEKNAQTQQQQAQMAAEEAGFAPSMQEMTFVPQMGGMQAVRARQTLLSQKTGQSVSLRDAAQHLEQEMATGLERLLQNPKIRSNLKLDVNTSLAGQAAETPRTLNNTVSAQSSQAEARPHPLDFATKRKLWAQRMQRDQETRTGR